MHNLLYKNKLSPYIYILILTLISTFILWLPFILKFNHINGIKTSDISFETVLKHWDGPLYIIPAKTLYQTDHPVMQNRPLGLNPMYFAAHLPLYPLTIKILSPVFGFPKATLVSTLCASIMLFWLFYFFISKYKLTKNPLLLTSVLMFITPRFFVIRSIGSPEPLLMVLILGSMLAFIEKKYLFAGLLGGLAVITKSPGGLLFPAYLFYLFINKGEKKLTISILWILLIPIGLLLVFLLYGRQYGDFLAYFHSGDNLHLVFPPFSVFNYQKPWVSESWLEEIVFIYFFYGVMVTTLMSSIMSKTSFVMNQMRKFFQDVFSKYEPKDNQSVQQILFCFSLIFFIALILVQHRDISRYALPLLPIALITFEKFFTSKKFLIVLIILIPAIYAYAWNFMLVNVAPIADWTPFL